MVSRGASFLLRAARAVIVFSVIFAIAGALLTVGINVLHGIDPTQRELAILLMGMFALYAAGWAALLGAVTGLLYSLIPASAHDSWVAMALGLGVVIGAILLRAELGQPLSTPWLLLLAPTTAIASAASVWIVRRTRPGDRM